MALSSEEFAVRFATEFCFGVTWERGQIDLQLTQHSYSDRWIEGREWVVVHYFSSMNPWYLTADGTWRYKSYSTWPTWQEAREFLFAHAEHPLDSYERQA